jgi:hypothetical protein
MLDVAAFLQINWPFGFANDLADAAATGHVQTFVSRLDVARQTQHDADLATADQFEGIDDKSIQRIGHHQHQALAVLTHWQRPCALKKAGGNALLEDRQRGIVFGNRQRQAELRRQSLI